MNRWLLLPAILIIVLITWTATTQITRETILSETQAASRVETFYNGHVQHSIKKGTHYFITFTTDFGVYEVAVDEENGRFSQLHLIQKTVPAENSPEEARKPEVQEQPRITHEQAQQIALQAYPGEIEAITLQQSADGGYYLVEVDSETTDVILQIHALTGIILTVSFEN